MSYDYCLTCSNNIGYNKQKTIATDRNYNNLKIFCNENNIILNKDYSNEYLNKQSFIEGKCKTENCNNIFNKKIYQLFKTYDYCTQCSKINGNLKNKMRNTTAIHNELNFFCKENNIVLTKDYSEL